MMKPARTALLAMAAVAAIAAPPAAAQRIDSPYRFLDHSQSIGVYGGYLGAREGRLSAGPQPAPVVGAHWAIRLSGPITLGAELGFSPMKRTVRDTAFVAADSLYAELGEADLNLLLGMANLRFNVTGARTWNGLQPFFLFGGGIAMDLSGASSIEQEIPTNARFSFGTSFAGQLAAGVEWFPSERVSVRADARNVLWKLSIPEAFILTENARTFPRSEWEQNYLVSAGLSFHF
jgi:opacity protein-like surface antigen